MRARNETDSDGESYEVIYDTPRLTPYDRRFTELRSLQQKREDLLSNPVMSGRSQMRVAILTWQIGVANERFKIETARAVDEQWRTRRSIDEWRGGEGRDEYNASRRRVRAAPNTDTSNMTPEQKVQHGRDRRSDANWLKRCRDKGMPEEEVAAAFTERLEARKRERAASIKPSTTSAPSGLAA